MRKLILFISGVSWLAHISGQTVKRPLAPYYPAVGAYSATHTDVFSVTGNLAALAMTNTASAGVYGNRQFMLSDINDFSAVLAFPSHYGNFAIRSNYLGNKNYNESQIGGAYAKKLGPKAAIGAGFNYFSFIIPGYTHASTITYEAGLLIQLSEKFFTGINVYNPIGGRLWKTVDERLAFVYKWGFGWEPSESFFLTGEIIKEEGIPANVNAAFQYDFEKQFFARFGITSTNQTPFAGAGIYWNRMRLDVSAAYHPQLGISPAVMVIINFTDNHEKN